MPEGCSPESAGRPLEPAGNGRPRWMVALGGSSPRTGPGLQVDSSAALPGLGVAPPEWVHARRLTASQAKSEPDVLFA
jgi:hypothetical protein